MTLPPIDCRMTVHIFGAVSSPCCANFALKRLANDNKNKFSCETIKFIQNQFYVDDGLYSAQTVPEAIKIVNEARDLCKLGQLRLHKFVSNSRQLMALIPVSERAETMRYVDLNFDDLPSERALGIKWNTDADTLQFMTNATFDSHNIDRRGVLSAIASLYDPLGCIAPFILIGKLILQQMCKENVNWDDPLPNHLKPKWEKWLQELEHHSPMVQW